MKLLNIGFGNVVATSRIVCITSPESSPMKRMKEQSRKEGRLIDATYGRKTRAIIVTDSNHIILSSVQSETMAERWQESFEENKG